MAFITCEFKSTVLFERTTINVVLPDDVFEDLPTVYLLHGMSGDRNSWARMTALERIARSRGLAIVLADAQNSYYTDMVYGSDYYTFFTEELVDYTRKVFPLSKKREKTFVAGFSMGGYGAFKLALSRPDLYAAAASLSGVLDIVALMNTGKHEKYFTNDFGHDYQNTVAGSPHDLLTLSAEALKSGGTLPRLFACCGTEDSLYPSNVKFKEHMDKIGYELEWHEGEGAHAWPFWSKWLPKVLDFLIRDIPSGN